MRDKFLLLFFVFSFCIGYGFETKAQKTNSVPYRVAKITGKVLDQNKEPLPGATITVVNKHRSVVSDQNGVFTITVEDGTTLRFTFLGMKSKDVIVSASASYVVVLEEEANVLDQVVINGYTQTTKRRITGSISSLKTADLKGKPTANLDMLMQGKVAGVDVKAISGRPGESAKIRIRGTNTITGNAEPLWVVDGVPLQRDIPKISSSQVKAGEFNDIFTNGISGINPNDIESVTVLKDASAAAIYGSRAAGGVIVVTTKKGQAGQMRVNYSTNVSLITKPPRNANLMNSTEKLAWEQELWNEFSEKGFKSGGYYPTIGIVGMIRAGKEQFAGMSLAQQDNAIAELGKHTTNWFDELFQTSMSNSHYLSLSGGNDKNTYYVSLGYSKDKGLVKKTDYSRYNVNAKLDMKPNKKVSMGFILDLSMQESNGSSLGVDPFIYAYYANPYERPYNADGSLAADNTYFKLKRINGGYDVALPSSGYNIFREMEQTSSVAKNVTANVTGNIAISLLENLKLEGLASYGYTGNNTDNVNGKDTYAAFMDRPFEENTLTSKRTYGSITQSSAYNLSYNLRGQLHYSKDLNKSNYISMLLGTEIRGQYAKSINEKRYGYDPVTGNSSMPIYPSNGTQIDYNKLISYAAIMDGLSGQNISEEAFASFYASMDYAYKQRYIASLTARTDGSNNFGSKEQFNPTGSIGLSWNIDQESFMKPLKNIVSSLSLRAATGYTGNINKTVYPDFMMDYDTSFRKTNDDYFRMGSIRNAPNPFLRWERTRDMKLSLDAGFFKERIRTQIEVYSRKSMDVVTNVRVPSSTGFTTQSYNTSELLNQGAEFSLSGTVYKGKDLTVSASANIAYNFNKLTKYVSPTGSIYGNYYVGYPLGSIFTGKCTGIDPKLGIYMFEARPDATLNTVTEKRNSANYLFYVGTSNAPANGGYSLNASYKNLSLNIGGTYSFGAKISNNLNSPVNKSTIEKTNSNTEPIPTNRNDLYVNHLNVSKDVANRWTENNPIVNGYPRILDAFGTRYGLDDYMTYTSTITNGALLENVSYFKIGSISLSYSLNGAWMKKLKIQSIGLSVSMSNIHTFTNYSGIDPETPGAVYPMPRTFSTGLSVGF